MIARLAAPMTWSNGLFPRPFCSGAGSSSPSESGTCRKDADLERGFERAVEEGRDWILLGGAASLRALVDCVCDSYSTEVLRGTVVLVEPEAQAPFGVCMSVAAWWKAAAMLTEVSFTLHFSGSSDCDSDEFCLITLGGDREPRVGAP
jgi:hypothetical protein